MKHFKFKYLKKSPYDYLDALKNFKKTWMFLDNDIKQIEIIEPTIENLKMMKDFKMHFVVKGFNSLHEYLKYEKLRIDYGVATMMVVSKYIGAQTMFNAILATVNNTELPSNEEVQYNIKKNVFIDVKEEEGLKRLLIRKNLENKLDKLTFRVKKEIVYLVRKKRLTILE